MSADRCHVCDRPPTTWKPVRFEPFVDEHGLSDSCPSCGEGGTYIWWPEHHLGESVIHRECWEREHWERAFASAADPSVCWGGVECRAHAVDWRAECLWLRATAKDVR